MLVPRQKRVPPPAIEIVDEQLSNADDSGRSVHGENAYPAGLIDSSADGSNRC
jgi:hypothetical protein